MIEAKELRIGNLIKWTLLNGNKSKANEVELICKDGINIKGVSFLFKEIEPIPLTEEWLIKFGFEEHTTNHKYYKFGCAIFRGLGDSINRFYYHRSGHSKCIEIKYVHQLQNLYFALTNEELTIK
jgi:hypothetical protein